MPAVMTTYRYRVIDPWTSGGMPIVTRHLVERKTPKGAFLADGRYVLDGAGKRWAHETEALALQSYRARKARQIVLARAAIRKAEAALAALDKGAPLMEPRPFMVKLS